MKPQEAVEALKIIATDDPNSFNRQVADVLAAGFLPYGQLRTTAPTSGRTQYIQQFVKFKETS